MNDARTASGDTPTVNDSSDAAHGIDTPGPVSPEIGGSEDGGQGAPAPADAPPAGPSAVRLILLRNEAMVTQVVCAAEAVYMGSREDCRLQIADPRLAPQQAVVYPSGDGSWVIEPLDASCPMQINGVDLLGKVELKTGDEIRLLQYAVRVYPEHTRTGATHTPLGLSPAQLERFAAAKIPFGTVIKRADETVSIHPSRLHSVARATVQISGCVTIEELIDTALQQLLAAFAAQRAWIGVRRGARGPLEYEEGRLLTGQAFDLPQMGNDWRPRIFDRNQFILVPRISRQERISILCGPLNGPGGTLGMVYLDSGESGRRYDQRDLDAFVLHLNAIAYRCDAISRTVARNKAALIEGQVSVAHDIQLRLTPRKLPQWPDQLQTAAFRETGRDRAGDIYDLVRLANNLAACMIAHTPAEGSLPALLMTQAQTAFRAAVMHQDPPSVCLRMLNWMLYDGQTDHPLECFIGVIDPATGQMSYAVAGDIGAYLISARGEARRLGPTSPAPALGAERNPSYALLPEQMNGGETLVLFTPAVTSVKNSKGESFGLERFINIFCDGFGQLPSAMLQEMLAELRSFTEGGQQPEDVTVLVAQRCA